jgi:hypothetical protein
MFHVQRDGAKVAICSPVAALRVDFAVNPFAQLGDDDRLRFLSLGGSGF